MSPSTPGAARVLVATDNGDDANQIVRLLGADFQHLRASTRADRYVLDFEEFGPDVLVLAFDSLDKAQRYYLGLYRSSPALRSHPHRTVMLCSKYEVQAVFELCKKAYFDDYVLYWPHTHDGPRLAMSIWIAGREMARQKDGGADPLAEAVEQLARQRLGEGAAAGVAEATPAAKAKKARPIVLVVEDDELTRRLVNLTLDAERYETQFVGDGPAALRLLESVRPDLILMDIKLPGIDGVSLTQRLKAAPALAAIPVIMMSGDARRETLVLSMEVGAAGFVVKPFTRQSLNSKLEKFLPR